MLSMITPSSMDGQHSFKVPNKIETILNSKYPGWQLVDREPFFRDLHLDTMKCRPNFVWGDFDGDVKQDYAVFIECRTQSNLKEEVLIVFLARGSEFLEYLIETAVEPVYIATFIWIAPKGSRSYDFDRDREFTLKRDAIEIIVYEKASDLLYYDKGKFKRITASD